MFSGKVSLLVVVKIENPLPSSSHCRIFKAVCTRFNTFCSRLTSPSRRPPVICFKLRVPQFFHGPGTRPFGCFCRFQGSDRGSGDWVRGRSDPWMRSEREDSVSSSFTTGLGRDPRPATRDPRPFLRRALLVRGGIQMRTLLQGQVPTKPASCKFDLEKFGSNTQTSNKGVHICSCQGCQTNWKAIFEVPRMETLHILDRSFRGHVHAQFSFPRSPCQPMLIGVDSGEI